MEINEDVLYPYLLFNDPVPYADMMLYPVRMDKIIDFQICQYSITIRKNSVFPIKQILKMSYFEFLMYCFENYDLAKEYNIRFLPHLYKYAFQLFILVFKDQLVDVDEQTGLFKVNNTLITPEIFDDLRRIIIIQNGIDFNIDEFIHYDTQKDLEEAKEKLNKSNEKYTIEDYIDSYKVAMKATDEEIKDMTIRKFWRYIRRINAREDYTIAKTGEMSGMVSFKKPLTHWMASSDNIDKYSDVKTSEDEIRSKVG